MSHKNEYKSVRDALDFEPKPLRYFSEFGVQLFSVILMIWLFSGGLLGWLGAQFVFAVWTFRNFALMHEAVHGALLRRRSLNYFFGRLHSNLCFLPYESWRSIHIEHHTWAGNIQKDPTMRIVKNLKNSSVTYRRTLNAIWKSRLPALAFLQNIVFWSYPFKEERESNFWYRSESVLCMFLFAAALFSPLYLPFGGVLPGLFVYLYFVEIFNFPHHIQVPYVRDDVRLDLYHQAEVSRSCRYHPLVEAHLLLNFNFHGEHHLFPRLPWHELPAAYRRLDLLKGALSETRVKVVQGNEWMRSARAQRFEDLFQPTQISSEEKEGRAA